jgi:hypothetical protein
LGLDDLKSKFGSRFLKVFDLLVSVPFLVVLHSSIYVVLTVLQHPVAAPHDKTPMQGCCMLATFVRK